MLSLDCRLGHGAQQGCKATMFRRISPGLDCDDKQQPLDDCHIQSRRRGTAMRTARFPKRIRRIVVNASDVEIW
jgi:hypothetical protein